MSPSILGQRRVQLSLATPNSIPLRLAMANNQEATDSEPHRASLAAGDLTREIDYRYRTGPPGGTSAT